MCTFADRRKEKEERLAAKEPHAVPWKDGCATFPPSFHCFFRMLGYFWALRLCWQAGDRAPPRAEQYFSFGADQLKTVRIRGRACVRGERVAQIVAQQTPLSQGRLYFALLVAISSCPCFHQE